jgi:hypothetical protein
MRRLQGEGRGEGEPEVQVRGGGAATGGGYGLTGDAPGEPGRTAGWEPPTATLRAPQSAAPAED